MSYSNSILCVPGSLAQSSYTASLRSLILGESISHKFHVREVTQHGWHITEVPLIEAPQDSDGMLKPHIPEWL